MRFAIELDILNRFRRKKPVEEKRSATNITSPFLGVFGRTKSGVDVSEEGALSLSSVYAAISKNLIDAGILAAQPSPPHG